MNLSQTALIRVYQRLFQTFGPQGWWPGETPLEIMIGAVLTQNTAWSNVERAIENLKSAKLLDLERLLQLSPDELAMLIRPAGYFNIKAKRLQSLSDFLQQNPDLEGLSTQALRKRLLAVHGIGPETADDILLYAFKRPVFVIDAYTRRLFSRLGMVNPDLGYEPLRAAIEQALGPDSSLFNEYHALIVRQAKEVCRSKPLCEECCLSNQCKRLI